MTHNNFACNVMQPQVHVNAYSNARIEKKFIPAMRDQVILYVVASHRRQKHCEAGFS